MATISALMIANNEEKFIGRALESISPIVDEIVVVDTGSRDRTLHICRQFRGIKIVTYQWVHDFSKARNHGLKQCTKDWVIYIDADEILDKRSASEVKAAVDRARDNVAGFSLHVVDHEDEWGELGQSNPEPFFKSPQTRVFRRDGRISFEGRVEESVTPSMRKHGLGVDVLSAKLHHYLWRGKGEQYAAMKTKYYRKLGSQVVPPTPSPEARPLASKVGIAMVALNALDSTKRSMESICKNTEYAYDLFLVDNGSVDGTSEYFRSVTGRSPIRLARNGGVAKGRNVAAAEALKDPSVRYVCFMDNDVRVPKGWLTEMVSAMEEDDKIGVAGPASNWANGAQRVTTTYEQSMFEAEVERAKGSADRLTKVDRLDRFCLMVRTDVLGKIGLFDDGFGPYGCEDEDFCRRVIDAGFDLAVTNRVFVEHEGGATFRANRDMSRDALLRSARNRMGRKWGDPAKANPAFLPPSMKDVKGKASVRTRNPETSIVILAHNRLDQTKPCVEAIRRNTTDYELIVVDNGSTDGTKEWLESVGVRVIRSETNLGVPKGRNLGLRVTTKRFVVMMDNDAFVRKGWLDELYAEMRNRKADVVGIEAWCYDKTSFCASKKCIREDDAFDYLGGACCLFKRKVFEEAGLLDEGFSPAYYEDLEMCVRAKNHGFRLAWKPTGRVSHKEHQTLIHGQKEFDYRDQLARSHDRFARIMRGELEVKIERLAPLERSLNILYLGMQWDYGHVERGNSFEHDNFFPALRDWDRTGNLNHFDFVALAQKHGVPKMSSMLMETVEREMPDAMFCVFFNSQNDPRREVVRRISEHTPTTTIGWFCDSHWRYGDFDRPWADNLNFCTTTSTVAYDRYVRDGLAQKTIKTQWAAAPGYVRTTTDRDKGATFVGQPHGDRRRVVQDVRSKGINLEVFGTGWSGNSRLSFSEMVRTFNRSKVNLNLNNACDAKSKQIKGRNFEVPACGGFLLTGKAENLNEYYEYGKEIETFDNQAEMVDKIKYYLEHDEERETIAQAGYERTLREHTYASRFEHIFSRAGVL